LMVIFLKFILSKKIDRGLGSFMILDCFFYFYMTFYYFKATN
jgi:hypothetical protein